MQLSVLYCFECSTRCLRRTAGREANFGPVVKRLTDIVWVDASVAAPTGGKDHLIGENYRRSPRLASALR